MIELSEGEIEAVKERIAQLKVEHRDLDDVIGRLLDDPRHDELQMRRLKRRKLLLKDQIALLERQLNPDIRLRRQPANSTSDSLSFTRRGIEKCMDRPHSRPRLRWPGGRTTSGDFPGSLERLPAPHCWLGTGSL